MTWELLEVLAAGAGAGLLAGLFGVGGGILFVPALVLVADLAQVDATATSLAAMIPVVVLGTWRNRQAGTVRWRPAAIIGVASAAGTAGGATLAESVSGQTLEQAFAALLLLTAGRLAWTALRRPAAGSESESGRTGPGAGAG